MQKISEYYKGFQLYSQIAGWGGAGLVATTGIVPLGVLVNPTNEVRVLDKLIVYPLIAVNTLTGVILVAPIVDAATFWIFAHSDKLDIGELGLGVGVSPNQNGVAEFKLHGVIDAQENIDMYYSWTEITPNLNVYFNYGISFYRFSQPVRQFYDDNALMQYVKTLG
jgi:hypothetical protein